MAYQEPQQQQYAQGQNVQTQDWSNSLLDCGPCDLCCLGTFLPCLVVGKTAERMRDPSMSTYEPINSDCLLMGGITWFGCGWLYAMIKRGEVRERFGIKGDGMSDCCASYWCACCVVIQNEKESQARLAAGPVMQGYQAQHKEGMQMPAQNGMQMPAHN